MHIPGSLHITQYVLLQLWYWLQGVRYVLVLLDITNDFCRLGALGEVNQRRLLNDGWNAILNESQVGKIDTYIYL